MGQIGGRGRRQKKTAKFIIGRKDKADFPLLGLSDVDVKIDTGAYTSSIHCRNISLIDRRAQPSVRFSLFDPRHKVYNPRELVLPVVGSRSVKSSFGHKEDRIVIRTNIRLFGEVFEIDLSLADRGDMNFPILLGRQLLRQGFLVDINRYNLSYRAKLKGRIKK
ncbi:MAG: RimK/LysX family protein [Candidatus Krumholzibacteria bacterium]|nr:RimK/LysX family protein [Candidatus Krumholzibacteria bacterium]